MNWVAQVYRPVCWDTNGIKISFTGYNVVEQPATLEIFNIIDATIVFAVG